MLPESAAVIILAGGSGSRLRRLYPDLPKPMIPVAGRPFLDWICSYWASQGIHRAIISLGHLAEIAEKHLAARVSRDLQVNVVREGQPLGTGGAVRFATGHPASTDPFVVTNGDSLLFADLSPVWPILARDSVDGVLLACSVADASRYGSLRIGEDNRLRGFLEKRPGPASINGGVYFLKRKLLPWFPSRTPLSMELDVFPALLAAGARLYVHLAGGDFLDIGTPESIVLAGEFIERHRAELALFS